MSNVTVSVIESVKKNYESYRNESQSILIRKFNTYNYYKGMNRQP